MSMRTLALSQELPRPALTLVPTQLPADASAGRTGSTRRIASQRLLEGSRELVIEHQGNEYHLRLTRNDKLILTK
jgi:hemin uptake protein HemP